MRTSYDTPTTHKRRDWWGDRALCREKDPATFFPDDWRRGIGELEATVAKQVCARCPVIEPCLAGALERREPVGIWGGLDPDERGALVTSRGRITQAPAA
ncbi:WhiB family transcriptional regulator [Streptomyces carpinensis]|uniref:Transcriptional regulator WhiB n=1 Tax=Streptomyces carpinensis TaxID=66369 RepID=A0ABV1VVP7_9ACTN|nr:WhiB family transcriptional regulator [Streptomyces carpinensis]